MTKKYGGYTAAELRELVDVIPNDRALAIGVIRDLLDALSAPAEAKRGTDAQILIERKLTCEAIDGAMAFGYQNTNPPPGDDHWLAPYWKFGRGKAVAEATQAGAVPAATHFVAKYGDGTIEYATSPDGFDPDWAEMHGGVEVVGLAEIGAAPQKVAESAQDVAVPQAVIDALRFYAHGHHYSIDADHQQFDTVSGEPQNWLFSERDDDCTMIEDGSIAEAALCGGVLGFEEPTEPIEGEVLTAAPQASVADAARGEPVSGHAETCSCCRGTGYHYEWCIAPTHQPARASEAGEAVAYLVTGIDRFCEQTASVWIKRANADAAMALLSNASITPLAPLSAQQAVTLTDAAVSVPRRVVELLQLCNRDGIMKRATELQEAYRLIDAAMQSHSHSEGEAS